MSGFSIPASGALGPSQGGTRSLVLPLRLHILGIVLAALLPVMLAGGAWMWREALDRRQAFRQTLVQAAQTLARSVDAQLAARRAVAIALSNATELEPGGNRAAFEQEIRAAARQLDASIFVIGPPPEMQHIFNTGLPEGRPMPAMPEARALNDAVARLFASGEPQISRVRRAPFFEGWVSAAFAPMRNGGRITGALGVGIDLPRFGTILNGGLPLDGSWAELVDDAGTVAAHSGAAGSQIGSAVRSWFASATAGLGNGLVRGPGPDGTDQVVAFAGLSTAPGWLVSVGAPTAMDTAAWQRPLPALGAALLATLTIGASLALLLARWCLRTVAGLSELASAVSAGRPVAPTLPRSGVAEFDSLQRSLESATESLLREAAAAQRERALLQTVIDSTPDPVIVKGLDGRVQLANAAAGRAYGRNAAAMIGEVPTEWLSPERGVKEAAHDAAVLATGSPLTEEHAIPEMENRVYRISKIPLQAQDGGSVTGIVTIMQDTTKQRQSEAELRTAEAEMQHLGRRATVGVMASGLAHELNQPLTAATNYLRAAGRLLEREDALRPDRLPVLREAVGAAAEQSLRAGEIVRRLREFLGRRVSAPVLEPVASVVEEGLRLALSGQVPPDLAVVTRLPPSLGSAMLDRVPVQQILVNLVRNAVEAMRGRTRQSLTVAARRFWQDRQPWIEISVSDTGPGLPPEVASRLFEPFVGTKPDGLGVGLAICRRFAESQGGRIEAARNAEGGMIFTLTLPAGVAAEQAKASANDSTD